METYKQIHDFTAAGASRFAAFLADVARPDVNAVTCRMECLGVLEDALNADQPAPLTWELPACEAVTNTPTEFAAELADLIVETVIPSE